MMQSLGGHAMSAAGELIRVLQLTPPYKLDEP